MVLRPITLLGVVISMVGGLCIGVAAFWTVNYYEESAMRERLLVGVAREIRDHYVEEVATTDLVDDAIRGMVEGLDRHSGFLDQDGLQALEQEASGHFGGIGLEVGMVDGYITVLSPLDGTPAARAGIVAGDRLIEVDHTPLKGRTLDEAIGDIRGQPGTTVHLRIRRAAQRASLDFDLTRDRIASVTGRLLSDAVGYVRLSQFDKTSGTALTAVVEELQAATPLTGLVLDLRNNPGGLLEAAVDVADTFLAGGLIVSTEGRGTESHGEYDADTDDILNGAPLAVLINDRSASAAEVVAGALKDRERAILLGTASFGKGSVQSVMRFEGRAIKLTTARYVTPSGVSIDSNGVAPHIEVPRSAGERRADYDKRLFAAALAALSDATEQGD
ncbi:MAG: S41 family peptidase [Gammaproteobacteria bacterium]|nr:S41 family peptidase [Gammaproteobacteria bacterium]